MARLQYLSYIAYKSTQNEKRNKEKFQPLCPGNAYFFGLLIFYMVTTRVTWFLFVEIFWTRTKLIQTDRDRSVRCHRVHRRCRCHLSVTGVHLKRWCTITTCVFMYWTETKFGMLTSFLYMNKLLRVVYLWCGYFYLILWFPMEFRLIIYIFLLLLFICVIFAFVYKFRIHFQWSVPKQPDIQCLYNRI